MSKTLVVVESPSKVKKIQSYLGDNYIVTSSMGHFRGLDPKKMSIDIPNSDNSKLYKYIMNIYYNNNNPKHIRTTLII